jgi:drug/metabolite transporter (DMT)-like permease
VAATDRSRAIGYAMVAVASTLFAINAPVVKVLEHSGSTAQRLTEIRSAGAFIGFALFALLLRPQTLRVTRRQLLLLAARDRRARPRPMGVLLR